jgi:hypothetical protein
VSRASIAREPQDAAQAFLSRLTTLLANETSVSDLASRGERSSGPDRTGGATNAGDATCDALEALIPSAPSEQVAQHLRRLTAFRRTSYRFASPRSRNVFLRFANGAVRHSNATAVALQSHIDEESAALSALLVRLADERAAGNR